MVNSEKGPRDINCKTPGQQGFSWLVPGGKLEVREEVWSRPETTMRTRPLARIKLRSSVTADAARTVVEFDVD